MINKLDLIRAEVAKYTMEEGAYAHDILLKIEAILNMPEH